MLKESDRDISLSQGADHLIFDGMSAGLSKTQIEQGLKGTTSMENTLFEVLKSMLMCVN
ncbi:hypothetical protein LSPH24S_01719 [Lysinibacillus sphaericus]